MPVGYIRFLVNVEDNGTTDNILATKSDVEIGRHVEYELPADSSAKENALLKATVKQDVAGHFW